MRLKRVRSNKKAILSASDMDTFFNEDRIIYVDGDWADDDDPAEIPQSLLDAQKWALENDLDFSITPPEKAPNRFPYFEIIGPYDVIFDWYVKFYAPFPSDANEEGFRDYLFFDEDYTDEKQEELNKLYEEFLRKKKGIKSPAADSFNEDISGEDPKPFNIKKINVKIGENEKDLWPRLSSIKSLYLSNISGLFVIDDDGPVILNLKADIVLSTKKRGSYEGILTAELDGTILMVNIDWEEDDSYILEDVLELTNSGNFQAWQIIYDNLAKSVS